MVGPWVRGDGRSVGERRRWSVRGWEEEMRGGDGRSVGGRRWSVRG